ncbi:MAG: hypothetical protein QOE32_6246, partial [Pseudonocardiales bacterium]|nr:hypothetical protein [Pseudonocardiales bacterium]
MKVLLTDQAFPDTDLESEILAESGHDLIVASSPEDVRKLAPEADAILNALAPIGADLIAMMTKARIIARYGIGVDNIDASSGSTALRRISFFPLNTWSGISVNSLDSNRAISSTPVHRLASESDTRLRYSSRTGTSSSSLSE